MDSSEDKENNKKYKVNNKRVYYIPNDIVYIMMHYVRPDFIKKAFHSNRFTNFLEHHDILWNHLYNDDKNIVRKMKSINECKEVFFRRNSIIDNIKHKSNYPTECTSLVTCQRDMTMLKVVKVDNKYKLFTTSTDATIRYFEVSENEFLLVSSYLGHSDSIWALDADKNVIVSGSIDGKIFLSKINELRRFSFLKSNKLHKDVVRVLLITDEYIISGGKDADVKIFNKKLELITSLKKHKGPVKTIDANDEYLVTGSYDYDVILWSLKSKSFIEILHKHTHRVYVVKIFRNFVASADYKGDVFITNLFTKVFCKFNLNNEPVLWIDFIDNHIIASNCQGCCAKFDYSTGKLKWVFYLNICIKYQKVYNGILAIATMSYCKIFDAENGKYLKTLISGVQVTKVEICDDFIIVGYFRDEDLKLKFFKL